MGRNIKNIFEEIHDGDMIRSWKIGIIVYIKSKIKTPLINFRPITLLNIIYKLRATTIANRITPIMPMLTDERQHAYKSNRSTIDVV